VGLERELGTVSEAAAGFAAEGESLTGVVPAEPTAGERVYLCSFEGNGDRRWLLLDGSRRPVGNGRLVREAVSIAMLVELAEESAGGGDVAALRARLAELRATEDPEGIEEAESAAAELESALRAPPRVASAEYLDALGLAATNLERTLGSVGDSPFAAAMNAGMHAVEAFADEVEAGYKLPLR
jgi:hypothetical protein